MEARVVVVGSPFFLARHLPLVDALRTRLARVDLVEIHEKALLHKLIFALHSIPSGRLWPPSRANLRRVLERFNKTPSTFKRLSRLSARSIAERATPGTFALQLFAMSSPVATPGQRPYAHYIDMTMALVRRNWPEWAPYDSDEAYNEWIAVEGASYRGAAQVFTFTEATRRSLIADYGVDPKRVATVGAAGHYRDVNSAVRSYGNLTIIFNGSEFMRKGGDRALAAFRIVRRRFPDATLTIVANTDVVPEPGVVVQGKISRAELFSLFNQTDIVLAPTRLDALPGFVLEAMSCGVVPVLSDAESMSEMIVDGSEGYVASPPTADRLAECIESLFRDPTSLQTLGAAARARVAADWNWDRVAHQIIERLPQDGLR